jgi:hypothetical protein
MCYCLGQKYQFDVNKNRNNNDNVAHLHASNAYGQWRYNSPMLNPLAYTAACEAV